MPKYIFKKLYRELDSVNAVIVTKLWQCLYITLIKHIHSFSNVGPKEFPTKVQLLSTDKNGNAVDFQSCFPISF